MATPHILASGVTLRDFYAPQETREAILSRVRDEMEKRFPLENDKVRLELTDLDYPKKRNFSLEEYEHALLHGGRLTLPLKGTVHLIDKATNQPLDKKAVTLANVPYMTDDGTFVYGGNHWSTVNQSRLKPGIYARRKDNGELESHVSVAGGTGSQFRLAMEPETGVFRAGIQNAQIKLYPVLQGMGVSDETLAKAWGPEVLAANQQAFDKQAFGKFYSKILGSRAREDATPEEKVEELKKAMERTQFDPEVNSRTLGKPYATLSPEVLMDASAKLLNVHRGEASVDDRDHPANRTFHTPDDFLAERVRRDTGRLGNNLLYRATYDRSLKHLSPGYFSPQLEGLIVGNQLSSPLSGLNPVEVMDQQRRVIQLGEGGISSMESVPMSSRMVHPGQLGLLDPIRSSESRAIGVDQRLGIAAKKGSDNQIYLPMRNRKTGEVEYINPVQLQGKVIGFGASPSFGPHRSIPQEIMQPKTAAEALDLASIKKDSDVSNWPAKHRALRKDMEQYPEDWEVDSQPGNMSGITHKRTGWRFHCPRELVPPKVSQTKEASRAADLVGSPEPAAPRIERIPGMKGGKMILVDPHEIDYELVDPSHMFTETTNLAPLLDNMKGARTFIASKMMTQALPLVNPEAPLVDSLDYDTKEPYGKTIGHRLGVKKAPADGVVDKVTDRYIEIQGVDGTRHRQDLKKFFPSNRKTGTTEYAMVAPGDRVKSGQLIARNDFVDKEGHLALGKNLHVGFMPSPHGLGFEDAITVSESAAKKLTSKHLYGFEVEHRHGVDSNKNRFIGLFPNKYTNAQLDKLDANGMIKPGVTLDPGDPIFLSFAPRTLSSQDQALGNLHKVLRNSFQDLSQQWEKPTPGQVTHALETRHGLRVNVATQMPLAQGDKLCMTPDHEVLTKTGWKPLACVCLYEEVWTLDPATGNMMLETVGAIHQYDLLDESLYSLETTQVSMLVTADHRVPAQIAKSKDGDYGLIAVRDLAGKRYRLKKDARLERPDKSVVKIDPVEVELGINGRGRGRGLSRGFEFSGDFYCWLAGAYLSEGNIINQVSSGTFGIEICPKKPHGIQELKRRFAKEGITLGNRGDKFGLLGVALMEHFKQFGSRAWTKTIPQWILEEFSSRQLRILLDGLIWGDDSVQENGAPLYFTSSPQLADDIQQLCLLAGYSATIKHQRLGIDFHPDGGMVRGRRIVTKRDRYLVSIISKKNAPEINHPHCKVQKDQQEQWVNYSGPVFCLEVPENHTFYVRRKGKTHWTGNSGRNGAKGVSSAVLPDDKMPRLKTGEPLEVLINPAALIGRVNPAMIYEALLGKIAHKTGKPYALPSFAKESTHEFVTNELAAHGINDVDTVVMPDTGREIPNVLTGRQYFQKLEHISSDKLSARGEEGYDANGQPSKGGFSGGKRLGGLQLMSLLSHGVPEVIRDAKLNRGTSNPELWSRFRTGQSLPAPKSPFVYDKLIHSLKAAGINVERKGDLIHMKALTDREINEMAPHEVLSSDTLDPRSGEPVAGGLHGLDIHGARGDQWTHIKLDHPIPNPAMEDPVRRLLGLTQKQMREVIAGREPLNGKRGGEALEEALSKINLKDMAEDARSTIRTGRGAKRDDAVRRLNFVTGLQRAGLQSDEMMIHKIPVLPPTYRPITRIGDMMLISDANWLYKDLMTARDAYRSNRADLPEEDLGDQRLAIYDAAKAVTGLGDPISKETEDKGVKGFIRQIAGVGGPKNGFLHSKILSSPLNQVGRATAIPDASLHMDQVGVPEEMAWNSYEAPTMRLMVQAGMPAQQAALQIQDRTDTAKKFLMDAMEKWPLMLSRDPALHRFSIMGGHGKLVSGDAIRTSPLINKPMTLDHDGDQVNIHIPVSEEAAHEVRTKMLPSQNLFNMRGRDVHYLPTQEFVLGLHGASVPNAKKQPHHFATEQEARAAYDKGLIDIDTPVQIG